MRRSPQISEKQRLPPALTGTPQQHSNVTSVGFSGPYGKVACVDQKSGLHLNNTLQPMGHIATWPVGLTPPTYTQALQPRDRN